MDFGSENDGVAFPLEGGNHCTTTITHKEQDTKTLKLLLQKGESKKQLESDANANANIWKGMETDMEINFALHKHPLRLRRKDGGDEGPHSCDGCKLGLSGMIYSCSICQFSLHKSCLHLAPKVKGFFHPCPLFLEISSGFSCSICAQPRVGFTYHCARCSFRSDAECVARDLGTAGSLISHFSHFHNLVRWNKPIEPIKGGKHYFCYFCNQETTLPLLFCIRCDFFIHASCKEILGRKICRFDSHSCPLTLYHYRRSYQCNDCQEDCTGLAFRCAACDFTLCGACSIMPIIRANGRQKYIRVDGEPYILREINKMEALGEFCCYICGEECFGPTCVVRGNGCFHESCIRLPEKIENCYYHPHHPLSLRRKCSSEKCNLCLKICSPCAYSCSRPDCRFFVDIKCAFLTPAIHYPNHNHLLTVLGNINGKLKCNFCSSTCYPGSAVFRCGKCKDFALHLLCGPLPCTIKHKVHVHPLLLTEFFIAEDRRDFCCHVCEEYRYSSPYAYYCRDCHFTAELDCVIPEVLASLRGELGNGQLRTLGRRTKCKLVSKSSHSAFATEAEYHPTKESTLSFQDLLSSMKDSETDEWNYVIASLGMARKKVKVDGVSNHLDYLEAGYQTLMGKDKLQSGSGTSHSTYNSISSWIGQYYEDEEFVRHADYWVPRSLLPGFENLLARYGDIGAKSKLSLVVKSMCLLVLLDFLQVGPREQDDQEWNWYQKLEQYAGFETATIRGHMDRVLLELQIRRVLDEASSTVGVQIEQISQMMDRLKVESEVATARLEKIKRYANTGKLEQARKLIQSNGYQRGKEEKYLRNLTTRLLLPSS